MTTDPGLVCLVGTDVPGCGQACLPLSEYAPLIEKIVQLEELVATMRERMAHIASVATWP